MDSQDILQDVLRCHLCEVPMPHMYCDICQLSICKLCVGEHISDESKEHKVVPFRKRRSTPKCPTHFFKQCELHCEQCDIPICLQCVSSGKHEQHEKVDALTNLEKKKKTLENDLQELENTIYPKYQEIASIVSVQRAEVDKTYKKLKRTIDKQERDWRRDIDTIVKILRDDADYEESHISSFFDQHESKIKHSIDEIKRIIEDIKKIINSNDAYVVSAYKSRNDGFKKLPKQLSISLPSMYPYKIEKDSILQHCGSFATNLCILNDGYRIDSPCTNPTTTEKLFMDEPKIVSYIETGYGPHKLSQLSDEEIWMSSTDPFMRLYNLDGDLVKSTQTKSMYAPTGIAVTSSGDLFYTDGRDRTVNIVKNTETQTVIRLHVWIPQGICSTFSDDLLVIMNSDDGKLRKIVRYSGSDEIQSIEYDNECEDFNPICFQFFHITENRNLDICVTDNTAQAVVVVNQAGELRFRYTGPSTSGSLQRIDLRDITTDSQCRILILERVFHRIHIIDQDGHFLRYIDNCKLCLRLPICLCIDSKDNLVVGDNGTSEVNVIQYYMPMT
uniref:B box-type domain-containing protein n=1 Tax=Magallana gigas TaxID=29159 RepID=A0A8W8JH57_MAGGI|nr:uncharacterized protein LOC117691652 [Crassostrea gigas]